MKATIEAVFEDDVFKLVRCPGVREGERVGITVETVRRPAPEEPLELVARVYQGLRPEEIDDRERMALEKARLFARARA